MSLTPARELRVIGASVVDVSDYRQPRPEGKWAGFFSAVDQRYDLIDVVHAELSGLPAFLNLARAFHPRVAEWKASAGFNPWLARRRTSIVDSALGRHAGGYDLLIQHQTLFAPGSRSNDVPYVIYTDNTMALTQRMYRRWAPLKPSSAAWWIEYEAGICRSADAVFTCSEFARRSMIDDYGCSPRRVLAVGAGVNQSVATVADRDYGSRRALFVGIDFVRKGGDVLLSAWPRVTARLPDAELVLAGPTPNHLHGTVLPDGVRSVGRVDRSALDELYRSASMFVMPSLFEPYGLVFLEALAYGLPCIGTDHCAMPELIDDGRTGRLVPPGDEAALADVMIELLGDPARLAQMGQAAHASIARGHDWSDVVSRIDAQLRAL